MQQINAPAEASDSFRHFRSISRAHAMQLMDADTLPWARERMAPWRARSGAASWTPSSLVSSAARGGKRFDRPRKGRLLELISFEFDQKGLSPLLHILIETVSLIRAVSLAAMSIREDM
jgi:hypothetical protein